MYRRIPPIAALRAFEASAQLLSFKRAAAQLHRTPSAISHQIRRLEDDLGTALFHRHPGGLRLTDAGVEYLAAVDDALQGLNEASARLRRQHAVAGPVSISLFPSFAIRWLIPRLKDFRAHHPGVEVALVNSLRQADFDRDDLDAAIRFGQGDWPGLRADPLMEEALFPVCAPQLRSTAPDLERPADLASVVLLHNAAHPGEWQAWLAAAGVTGIPTDRGPVFDALNEVLAAAANGLGVAIGRSPLVDADLDSGRLVEPFDLRVRPPGRYWLVAPEATADLPALSAFRGWLLEQSGAGDPR